MVCIRLLDEEYQQVKQYCDASDGVSVSDLAREAMLGVVRGSRGNNNIASRVEELDAQLLALQERVERLGLRVASE